MYKHRFVCHDKETTVSRINHIMSSDRPRGKSLFGGDLFGSGIHFRRCDDEIVKGFYLAESETESAKRIPLKIFFSGEFVMKDGTLFLDVFFYPHFLQGLILLATLIFLLMLGNAVEFVVAAIVLSFFIKGYVDIIKDTVRSLSGIVG